MDRNCLLFLYSYWQQLCRSQRYGDLANVNTTDGSTVKLYQYKNGKNNVEIDHYKLINGGHDWPGTYGNMDINANSIIWNFLSRFDIDGKI